MQRVVLFVKSIFSPIVGFFIRQFPEKYSANRNKIVALHLRCAEKAVFIKQDKKTGICIIAYVQSEVINIGEALSDFMKPQFL